MRAPPAPENAPANAGDSAFDIEGALDRRGPFVFTCEHASNALPFGLRAAAAEQWLLDDHWGWDIGAGDVCRALVRHHGGTAVLARFSRLVADPNREPTDPTFIVTDVDGHRLSFNRNLAPEDRQRRTRELFEPFHGAIDATLGAKVAAGTPVHLVAVHSFTPVYRGNRRHLEVGVLFDRYDAEGEAVCAALAAQGLRAVCNEPYTGKPPGGLIYSAQRHGTRHGVKYLELEIRNDLIATAPAAQAVAAKIAVALQAFLPG